MNYKKWRNYNKHSSSDYVSKLAEEVGEVAKAHLEWKNSKGNGKKELRHIKTELEHVKFIVDCFEGFLAP